MLQLSNESVKKVEIQHSQKQLKVFEILQKHEHFIHKVVMLFACS